MREVSEPSIASGLSAFETDSPTWLIEPRRTKSVVKFSGTLVHPSRADKVGITLVAFVHFSYEISQKQLVFADIQGKDLTLRFHILVLIILCSRLSHEYQWPLYSRPF